MSQPPFVLTSTEHGRLELYKIIQKRRAGIWGDGFNGPTYGELTEGSMQKIIDVLVQKCRFDWKSFFIDIGSGLGKPNFHVAHVVHPLLSIGVEVEEVRYLLSIDNLTSILKNVSIDSNSVSFIKRDILESMSLDPFTHIYQFDIGFPPYLLKELAIRFNRRYKQFNLYLRILKSN
jgi:hypothetical protein